MFGNLSEIQKRYEDVIEKLGDVGTYGFDNTGMIRFDLIHHLHRLDDADNIAYLDVFSDFDEGRRGGRSRGPFCK